MLVVLVNTNLMRPLIAPLGLEYVACAARESGVSVEILDLALAENRQTAIRDQFQRCDPILVGVSIRNIDDCFWPSARWFIPDLKDIIADIRKYTDAPIMLGGVGFSIFPERIMVELGAEFGSIGDGKMVIESLVAEILGKKRYERVPGLVWRNGGQFRTNKTVDNGSFSQPAERNMIDNAAYFRLGGQLGIETKRGCNRSCTYCVEPDIRGRKIRAREPKEIADEAEALLREGIDVLHLCDSEFNLSYQHACELCREFIRRSLGDRLSWYAYLTVVPFGSELAELMRRAGCKGIDFTADSASSAMLRRYGQSHRREDIAFVVKIARQNDIRVMLDMLLGGPRETPGTAMESIEFCKRLDVDCVGISLGIRLYPGTTLTKMLDNDDERSQSHWSIRKRYDGPQDLLQPTFYISPALGQRPARLIKKLIAGDRRFFEPTEEHIELLNQNEPIGDYNYNENRELVQAINEGARGAYWDILQQLRQNS